MCYNNARFIQGISHYLCETHTCYLIYPGLIESSALQSLVVYCLVFSTLTPTVLAYFEVFLKAYKPNKSVKNHQSLKFYFNLYLQKCLKTRHFSYIVGLRITQGQTMVLRYFVLRYFGSPFSTKHTVLSLCHNKKALLNVI